MKFKRNIFVTQDIILIVVVESLSCAWLFVTPWTAAFQVSPSFTICWSLLKLMSIDVQWCHPTISSSLVPFCCPQSFPASRSFPMSHLFTSGGQTIGASASLSVPSNDYSGLISFRIDWFDLLAFQGSLKSLLQHHSLNASILRRPTFFMVQLSHPYSTTGKTWLLEKK